MSDVVRVNDNFHCGTFRALLQARQDSLDQSLEADALNPAPRAATFQTRVSQHILHQMTQPIRFRAKCAQVMPALLFIRYHPFRQHFRIHFEGGQRRAQFMRYRRDKCPAPLAQ